MRRFAFVFLSVLALLQGCGSVEKLQNVQKLFMRPPASVIPPEELQAQWVGRPLSDLEKKLGYRLPTLPWDGRQFYTWKTCSVQSYTVPAHSTAGFKMVNGHNVASLRNSSAVVYRTSNGNCCSVQVSVDYQTKKISGIHTSDDRGKACAYFGL